MIRIVFLYKSFMDFYYDDYRINKNFKKMNMIFCKIRKIISYFYDIDSKLGVL